MAAVASRPFTFGPCRRPLFEWRFPKANSIKRTPRASLRNRVSKTQSAWGSTKAACQFSRGRGRQAMHLPCKQAYAGALPADSTSLRQGFSLACHFNCGENEIQASFISSASVGATPTPATHIYMGSDPAAGL
jgi:hypothetical protein